MDTNNTYRLRFSHGATSTHETYEDALRAVVSVHPGAVTTHPGDIDDGGESTLCWASEEDAENDPGTLAIAKITKRHEVA